MNPNAHVSMLGFGLDKVGQWGELDTLLRDCPAVRPTTAERLSKAAYQSEYGIYDHTHPHKHPLATVMMHAKEDVWEGGPELTHIRRYHAHRYATLFNMSLDEYFAMPYYRAEFLYELVKSTSENLSSQERATRDEIANLERDLSNNR